MVPAASPGCPRCAGPRTVGHGCWPPGAPVTTTVAATDYRGAVAAAVVAAKVGGAHRAWPALAARLAERVAHEPPPVDAVTWVATGRDRVRRRGVDHAAVLAAHVAEALATPAVALLSAERDGSGDEVQRVRHRLPGTAVLLVDDVLTTGRTASAAAAALVRAGAERVDLAVLARAGDHPLVTAS